MSYVLLASPLLLNKPNFLSFLVFNYFLFLSLLSFHSITSCYYTLSFYFLLLLLEIKLAEFRLDVLGVWSQDGNVEEFEVEGEDGEEGADEEGDDE